MQTHTMLVRAAVRCREAYLRQVRAQTGQALESIGPLLLDELEQLVHEVTRACKARRCGLEVTAGRLVQRAGRAAERLRLGGLERVVAESRRRVFVPSTRLLYEELRAVDEEFGGLDIRRGGREIGAITETIVLEGVPLGPFRIELHADALNMERPASAFRIVALEPNPAAEREEITHPHVSGEEPCLGDALGPVGAAVLDGRLADAMALVAGVLRTYNAGSPFVQLEEWEGAPCDDCGAICSPEQTAACDACGRVVCTVCLRACRACGSVHCAECLITSDVSATLVCESCLRTCRVCHANAAPGELEDGRCPACRTRAAASAAANPAPDQASQTGTAAASTGGEVRACPAGTGHDPCVTTNQDKEHPNETTART